MSSELSRFRGRPPPPSWKPPPLPDELESFESKRKTIFESENSKESGEEKPQINSQDSKNVDLSTNVQKSAKEKSAESLHPSAKVETRKSEKATTSVEKLSPTSAEKPSTISVEKPKQNVEPKKEQIAIKPDIVPEQKPKTTTKTFEQNQPNQTFGRVSKQDPEQHVQTTAGISPKDNSKSLEDESSKVTKEDSFLSKQVLAAKDVQDGLTGRDPQNGLSSLKSPAKKPVVASNKEDEVKTGS